MKRKREREKEREREREIERERETFVEKACDNSCLDEHEIFH